MKRPNELLEEESCKSELLSISDQHLTILLSHNEKSDESNIKEESEDQTKSLLKMSVIPFHKRKLCSQEEKVSDEKLMSFLKQYDYRLTSESGAEYSFYEATKVAEEGFFSKIFGWGSNKRQKLESNGDATGGFNVELISPASEKQINRARPWSGRSMIVETKELYEAVTKPFIEKQKESLSWLQNIIEGKKEKERLLHDCEDWLLNIDTKWRSHPDALSVPKEEWLNCPATSDLYCLGIFKISDVASLRDLTGAHVPILKDMISQGSKVILDTYGVQRDQLRMFVHYQPQFYHFHVHFTRLENEIGCQVERGHLLEDIIQNLEIDSDYYKKKSITYVLRTSDKLYNEIIAHRKDVSGTSEN